MIQVEAKSLLNRQDHFAALLPGIVRTVEQAFFRLRPEARGEAIQEAVANAYVAFLRLIQQGRERLIFPTVLAKFAVRQVRAGRKIACSLNAQDVSSAYAQRRKRFALERLDRFDPDEGWKQAVVEDHRTPVREQVWFRIDFATWLKTLPPKKRQIARSLAEGYGTSEVATQFGISRGRVSQLRQEFFDSWQRFQGEDRDSERMGLLTAA